MRGWVCLLALLVSACVMNTKPAPVPQPQTFVVNARLGLPPYPGSVAIKREKSDGSSEADFETRDDLNTVYVFFNTQLVLKGWTRLTFGFNPAVTRVTAVYSKSGTQLKLNLDQKGKSGKYTLALEF
ncbi:MAG: hypothetical protein IVW51_16970 [Thermaceae bacterium]|nr:hypothetical protein [Thermaceae bacterium]